MAMNDSKTLLIAIYLPPVLFLMLLFVADRLDWWFGLGLYAP